MQLYKRHPDQLQLQRHSICRATAAAMAAACAVAVAAAQLLDSRVLKSGAYRGILKCANLGTPAAGRGQPGK
eukprot:365783-Chlamydomonas_euryale.AAC.26